jgi:DNA-binding NarL/FixJ family response regulator
MELNNNPTDRQIEVLSLRAQNVSWSEIACRLGISIGTARNHAQHARIRGEVRLTRREEEVCGFVQLGFPDDEIATRLNTSARTVELHRQRVFRKLQVANHAQLASKLYLQEISELNKRIEELEQIVNEQAAEIQRFENDLR